MFNTLDSDWKIICDIHPWPKLIFRSLLQVHVLLVDNKDVIPPLQCQVAVLEVHKCVDELGHHLPRKCLFACSASWFSSLNSFDGSLTCAWQSWWRHQMETFSALLVICAGNSPVPGEFPTQRPVTRSFGVFFYLRLNEGLRKQSGGWWFETLSGPLWRHWNDDENKPGSLFTKWTDVLTQDLVMSRSRGIQV